MSTDSLIRTSGLTPREVAIDRLVRGYLSEPRVQPAWQLLYAMCNRRTSLPEHYLWLFQERWRNAPKLENRCPR